MSDPSWLDLQPDGDDGALTLRLHGSWRLAHLDRLQVELETGLRAARQGAPLTLDGMALSEIDSASALVLWRALARRGAQDVRMQHFAPGPERIVQRVRQQLAQADGTLERASPGPLARLGREASDLAALLVGHLNFLGATLAALAQALARPSRLRWRELTVQLEQTGLTAIPVVALVTMLIGVVVAYLLGLQAEKYGANIFVVDGVAIGATREFAPIIVAVIVAGRSGAAFTAQLGSMRLTEETDAIRTLGLSPMQVLVLPRVLALMLALPLLVFVGDVMSLIGAMAIAAPMLDILPAAFLARLRESLDLRHLVVGLVKAPVFALVIAIIGARMGMTVGRDTRALGAATTSTVVQSIVAVILLDAAFAVVLQAMGI